MNYPGQKTRLSFIAAGLLTAGAVGACYRPDRSPSSLEQRYTNDDSAYLEIQGTRVHYRNTGSGPPLLLLHGAASSLHTWSGWTEHLRDSFRIIRPDLPGFGLTGPPTDSIVSPTQFVQFLHGFVEELDVDTVSLGGSSFGGLVALRYALDHPDRVRNIVLLNPMGLEQKRPLPVSLASLPLPKLADRFSPRFLVERVLRYLYGQPNALKDSVVDRYYELLLRDGNRHFLRQFVRTQSLPDEVLERSLRDVTAPVLLQWGCRDPWLPVELANRFHKTLPNSSLITYLSAGHVPMEERPSQTARDAKAFLSAG